MLPDPNTTIKALFLWKDGYIDVRIIDLPLPPFYKRYSVLRDDVPVEVRWRYLMDRTHPDIVVPVAIFRLTGGAVYVEEE